jgi:hypothetical protein
MNRAQICGGVGIRQQTLANQFDGRVFQPVIVKVNVLQRRTARAQKARDWGDTRQRIEW